MPSPSVGVNVHSVAADSAAAENVLRFIARRNRQQWDAATAPRYAVGGVVGRPDLTIRRRDSRLRRCAHRVALWLLTL